MERPEVFVTQKKPGKPVKERKDGGQEKIKIVKKAKPGIAKPRSANLKIHYAYVHASLFKKYTTINPVQLEDGRWEVQVFFRDQKITPVVDTEKDMVKLCKKVLDYQKKYGSSFDLVPVSKYGDKDLGEDDEDKEEVDDEDDDESRMTLDRSSEDGEMGEDETHFFKKSEIKNAA